jgi:hypothetical protein
MLWLKEDLKDIMTGACDVLENPVLDKVGVDDI